MTIKLDKKGFTIAEVLITTAMIAAIIGALAFLFQVVVASWSAQGARSGLGVGINNSVRLMARDLRSAAEVGSINAEEIRFSPDKVSYYIYYFYNAADPYPPSFNQSLYQIKKATLSGGINGTFSYGSGSLMMKDVLPPPASSLSITGLMTTIDLIANRGKSTIRAATRVKPRNM